MTAPGGPAPAHSTTKMPPSDLPEGSRGLQEGPLDPPEAAKGGPSDDQGSPRDAQEGPSGVQSGTLNAKSVKSEIVKNKKNSGFYCVSGLQAVPR